MGAFSKDALVMEMMRLYAGDPARIQHFVKVHAFAAMIGRAEKLDAETLETLEVAAIVHDIAIKMCEEKYGSGAGPLQEKEGPALAREMLLRLGCDAARTERVCFLVGHHHTYDGICGEDWQILVEADFLVNLFEGGEPKSAAERVERNIFRTRSGREMLREMFGLGA